MSKSFEEVSSNSFLQFISLKHKIPLKMITKAPKLQTGYVTSHLFRKKPTLERSANIRSTPIAYLQWVSPSTIKINNNPKKKKPNSEDHKWLPMFSSRNKIALKKNLKKAPTSCQTRRSLSLSEKTKEKSLKCQETWSAWNYKNSLLWSGWPTTAFEKSKDDTQNVYETKMTTSIEQKNCIDNVWYIGAKEKNN